MRTRHWLAVVMCAGILGAAGCKRTIASDPREDVRLLSGVFDEPWTRLADYINANSSTLRITVSANQSQIGLLSAIQQSRGDLGIASADSIFPSYQRGSDEYPHPHTKLRGIAVIGSNKLYVIVRANSNIRSVSDLRGKRVAYQKGEKLWHIILGIYGLQPADVRAISRTEDEMVTDFEHDRVDAAFLPLPIHAVSPLNRFTHVRALPIERRAINQLLPQYSFVKPEKVVLGELPGQQELVETVGTDALLVCRDDLGDELVYELTTLVFEWLARDEIGLEAWRRVDRESGPATPIPLHSGAGRFYRAREILR